MSQGFDFYSLRKTSMWALLVSRIILVNTAKTHDVYYTVHLDIDVW